MNTSSNLKNRENGTNMSQCAKIKNRIPSWSLDSQWTKFEHKILNSTISILGLLQVVGTVKIFGFGAQTKIQTSILVNLP